jgi:glycosyltransferase involved in cell wall biosynthesis
MKILHVITSLSVAGAQMMLYKLLSGMDRQRFDSMVVTLADDIPMAERIARLGIPVYALGMRSGASIPLAIWRLIRVASQWRPNLIQGWQYHGNLMAQFAALFLSNRVPVVWNIRHSIYHLGDEKQGTAAVIRLGARVSHKPVHIIYAAQASADQHESLGYHADRRTIIPNGFDIQSFVPCDEARVQIRAELGVPPCAIMIGLIARFHPVKDHANFLRAAADLLQSHPEVHFLLVGGHVDKQNSALQELIDSLNLDTHTHLLGEQDNIPRIMAALDIVSSTSTGEAFSNVIGEAMACGVPCVVTDVGDSALIVGDTGRVVPPKDPQALADAWREIIQMGRGQRGKLGSAARRRVEEHYSLAGIVARYEKLYSAIGKNFLDTDPYVKT